MKFSEYLEKYEPTMTESSTEDAAKALEAILGSLKDDTKNDIYKMGKGIMDYYKKNGSFSPDQASWIYKTSKGMFK